MNEAEVPHKIEKREAERNHNLNELFGMMRDFNIRFEKHMECEETAMKEHTAAIIELSRRIDEIAEVHTAFPKDEDGERDFKGHRHYHTKLIVESDDKGKFWSNRKDEIGKILLYTVLGLMLLGVNTYLNNAAHNVPNAVALP